MVDAVNTVTLQSSTLRPQTQASVSSAPAAEPAPSEAPEFVSSSIRVDNLQNVAILEYRSSRTGEVVQQYPTQSQIDAFHRAEKQVQGSPAPQPDHSTQPADKPAADSSPEGTSVIA